MTKRAAILVWIALTAGMALQASLTWFGPPNQHLSGLMDPGPGSNPSITAAAVFLSWLVLGAALILLTSSRVTAARAIAVLCYVSLALLYINVMRERTYYGDFDNYFSAAMHLRDGATLPDRYLYPPLWASLLAPLSSFGEAWTFTAAWTMNLVSTILVFVLLAKTLERYGFSAPLAVAVTMAFGLVNVPILRTLGYAQVNLHVLVFILLTLLWYPRSRVMSAVALAVAVNLKISPVVLAFAFLLVRDWRWLTWFGLSVLVIGAAPALAWGWGPYGDVLSNLRNVVQASGFTFREASIDSFVHATGHATGLPVAALIWPAKALLAAACLVLAGVHVRRGTFVAGGGPVAGMLNAMPALLILMVMAAPLVWEHHPVLLALSYLVIATLLTPTDWPLFGLAYFLEFLMPTFDFYPWSYGRLVSPLILLGLAWKRSAAGPPDLLVHANRRVARFVAQWSAPAASG